MIQFDNISKIYNDPNSKEKFYAIKNISCTINSGEITGLLGVNGAGKSTFLKMLSGNLSPTEGNIFINKTNLYETTFKDNTTFLKEKIGFVHEQPFFYDEETVFEILLFAINICNQNKIEAKNNFEKIINQCNLTEVLIKKIKTLSKGYKQRLSFALALSNNPEILLLDEPISGLDPIQINEIRQLIINLKQEKTIILSTHLMQEIDALCDKIIILNKGKIVAQGTEEEICKNNSTENIEQAFLKLVKNTGEKNVQ